MLKDAQKLLLVAQRLKTMTIGQVLYQHVYAFLAADLIQLCQTILHTLEPFGLFRRRGFRGIGRVHVHHVAFCVKLVIKPERFAQILDHVIFAVSDGHFSDISLIRGMDAERTSAVAHDLRKRKFPIGFPAPFVKDFHPDIRGQLAHVINRVTTKAKT